MPASPPPPLRPALDAGFARSLAAAAGLDELRDWLRRYRDDGVGADAMTQHLQHLLAACADEATQDRLLELLDLAAGFCPPQARIWP